MFSYLYRIFSSQFTAQIAFANMFNNSTQRLAAVATSLSPRGQSVLQHTLLYTYSLVLGLAQLFELGGKKNWMSPCSTMVSTECGQSGLKYMRQCTPTSQYIVGFILYWTQTEEQKTGEPWERGCILPTHLHNSTISLTYVIATTAIVSIRTPSALPSLSF